jgi:hypothetical protein
MNKMPRQSVATSSSYSFQWASAGWVNIDAYLHLLEKGIKKVEMRLASTKESTTVYQWLNVINNLTPLLIEDNVAIAAFPKKGERGAKKMRKTFCFAIDKDENGYIWFEKKFNPYNTSFIEMDLKRKDINEIKFILNKYDPGNNVNKRLNSLVKLISARELLNNRLQKIIADREIKLELRKVAFPCETEGAVNVKIGPY